MRRRILDGGDEDGVIALLVPRDDSALEMRGGADDQRRSLWAALGPDVVEAVNLGIGESPRVRLLVLSENADADPLLEHQRRVDRRHAVDAGENERRRQADGGEGADGHAAVASR